MITIYHVPKSRSLRVVWLMEEMGEDYRIEAVAFPVSDDFLKINRLGCVPAIVDDGPEGPITMFESLAILQYLTGRRLVAGVEAAKALTVGPLPDPAHYAEHLQFLHFGEADLATPIGAIFRTSIMGGEENATTRDQLGQYAKRLDFLDAHLADGRPFVTGEAFTIADISIGYAFVLAEFMQLGHALSANVAAYWQRLQQRPGYQRAIAR